MLLPFLLAAALQAEPAFAPAPPESQGIAPEWLAGLGAEIQAYVDQQKIVGAELVVIRGDRLVLHRGFGWRDREESVPMEPGGVFCLRSMTKALVGAAVQMLIDEDELEPGDPIARYLPAFDTEISRAITVEHLLTHTSGLPLSSLIGTDMTQIAGEQDIAALAGRRGPDFAPGTRYQYSDDGADTLGALIEVVSGMPLEDFLRERLFAPLGMLETTGVLGSDHPLRASACSHYAGGPGNWTRYWSPRDPPLFEFLLGSQALYGTALDYARFLHLLKEGGRVAGERLLSARAVRDLLEPRNEMPTPSGFEGLGARYGRMMQLWVDPSAGDALVAFGHGGSEGTIGWVFPALDLMVLYFTQSRNSLTVIEFGGAVQRHLLDPLTQTERAPPLTYAPEELAAYAGIYWEADDQEVQAVLHRGGRLALESPGKSIYELVPTSRRDVLRFEVSAAHQLEFERDAGGAVVAFTLAARDRRERFPRLERPADLPSAREVLELKRSFSDWTRIADLGGLAVRATLEMPALKLHGDLVIQADGLHRRRTESDFGSYREIALVADGRAWSWTSRGTLEELDGAARAQAELDHPLLPIADWRELYQDLEVLARVQARGHARAPRARHAARRQRPAPGSWPRRAAGPSRCWPSTRSPGWARGQRHALRRLARGR